MSVSFTACQGCGYPSITEANFVYPDVVWHTDMRGGFPGEDGYEGWWHDECYAAPSQARFIASEKLGLIPDGPLPGENVFTNVQAF